MIRQVGLSVVLVACGTPPAAPGAPHPTVRASVVAGPSSARAVEEPAAVSLTFIDDHNFPPGTELGGVPFGGISALTFDRSRRRWLALSDAHLENGHARMYELALAVDDHSLSATVTRSIDLGGAFESGLLDPEGLARDPRGGWLISTEGDGMLSPRLGPALYRIDEEGNVRGEVALAPRLSPTPSGPQTQGVLHNRGLEGLTTAPSGDAVYTINESPLVQDGEPATFEHGASLRLMRFDAGLRAVSEHHYLTEPVPRIVAGTPERVLNGVAALTAIADDRLLTLERATVKVAGVYHVRIQVFEVHLSGSEDVSAIESLRDHRRTVTKRLVIDLDEVVAQLEEGHRELDNFEGMALGPVLPSGAQSLLMVSDDNFSPTQRTALLAFALKAVAP